MNLNAIVAGLCLAGICGYAPAQGTRTYALSADSRLTMRFCLPPCLCPYFEQTGPVAGSYRLTFLGSDPQFQYYAVSAVQWVAQLPNGPVSATGAGTYRIGGQVVPVHQLSLDLAVGTEPPRRYDSGLVLVDPQHPFPRIAITVQNEVFACRQNVFRLISGPVPCYADCNEDGVLNLADFGCFLTRFALAAPYADCNGDGNLNVADFGCFQVRFALGCP